MNLCIVSEYNCTFDDFAALVEQSQEQARAFLADFELIKVHDHKSVMLVNCTDMEAFQALLTSSTRSLRLIECKVPKDTIPRS